MAINSELLLNEHLPHVADIPRVWQMSSVVDVPRGRCPMWRMSHMVDVRSGRWPTLARVYLELLFYQATAQWTALALSCEGQFGPDSVLPCLFVNRCVEL